MLANDGQFTDIYASLGLNEFNIQFKFGFAMFMFWAVSLIFFGNDSMALGQSCTSTSEANLADMGKSTSGKTFQTTAKYELCAKVYGYTVLSTYKIDKKR